MTERSDTLNIGNIRLRKEYPVAQTQSAAGQPAIHPEVAEAARARIAALATTGTAKDYRLGGEDHDAPAVPTTELVTDKAALAAAAREEKKAAPLVRGRKMPSVLVPFLTAAGVFLLVLLLFKAPVIISQAQYAFSDKPTPAASAPAAEVVPAENTITIPKINVHAPVQYEPSIQEGAIQAALQNGVVHYGNTALPGQNGNVAIFGHSSNDWWEPGNYKFVFVLLDKLSPGDQLTIDYNSVRYTYEVTGSRVVEPTDVGVLNPTSTPTLSLITCTPPGTSLRRLVVTAKQISPDPSKTSVAAATPAASASSTLPNTSPSVWDKVTQAFKGITSLFGGSPDATPQPGVQPAGQIPSAK
jgi:LPXTG-site transpeptidase (sortase) family protein